MRTTIQIQGARENNLQNIDVEIPRDKLVVVTGMSGSGKSSLAFDTIYAEGQRRLLVATMGTPHCPLCGEALVIRTPHQMMEHLLSLPRGTEVEVRAPVYKIHGEDYDYLFDLIRVNGYRRARIDGEPRDLGDHIELDEDREHAVEAVVDTFVVGPGIEQQVVTSLEHGLKLGDGLLGFHITKPKQQGAAHKKFHDGF